MDLLRCGVGGLLANGVREEEEALEAGSIAAVALPEGFPRPGVVLYSSSC